MFMWPFGPLVIRNFDEVTIMMVDIPVVVTQIKLP